MSAAQDDKPVAVQGASVSIRVDEHFHHRGWFHFGFDLFDNTRFTTAQLQDLVDAGADGPALFTLDTSISGPVKTTDGTIATSHGVQIDFAASGHRIIGFADTDGDGSRDPGEHVVFRLVDEGSRGFDFDLKGEIDQPASNGGSAAAALKLDLTDAFSATDSDGDPVTLAAKSITVEVGEPDRDGHEPHEHGPNAPGPDGCEPDEPGQHEEGQDQAPHEGPNQVMPHLASLLSSLAGEAGHGIVNALVDRLTGDRADDSSPGQTPNNDLPPGQTAHDVLADLIGHDAFVFNEAFGASAFTHMLDKAGDFLDQLAEHFPPLGAALTELENGSGTMANILHELLPKDAPPVAQHQDNFVL